MPRCTDLHHPPSPLTAAAVPAFTIAAAPVARRLWLRQAVAAACAVSLPAMPGLAMAQAGAEARGVVRIRDGRELLRDCAPWYPRGMSFFGRLVPRGWKTDEQTMTAQREFGPKFIEAVRWMGGDLIRYQVGMPFIDPKSPQYAPSYLDELRDAVALARGRGMAVLLSMQWQERTGVDPVEKMPGASALRAWRALGPAFAQDLGILYELFNEPISPRDPSRDQWEAWRAGHQALIDDLRAGGVRNVLLVNGLNQGKTLAGAPPLRDPLGQLGYAIHPRLWDHLNTPREWDFRFGAFAERNVVLATEWSHGDKLCRYAGSETVEQFLVYLERHRIGLVGWGIDIPGSRLLQIRDGGRYELSTFEGRACESRDGGPGASMKRLFERNPTGAARSDASCPR